MKIKTAELIGTALDWAVAKCEGPNSVAACYYDDDGLPIYLEEADRHVWEPSTDWAIGGPIIEREKIALDWEYNETICTAKVHTPPQGMCFQEGPTPLIAAMRCFVASKLGDTVEVPEELQ